MRAGSWVGTKVEDVSRLALFIDGLEKGMDPAAAAYNVKKYLFDYTDLTKWEKGIFKRIMPFYTFTRKSIPLAFETLLTQPGKVLAMPKAIAAADANLEDPIGREYVSKFVRDGLGVPIRKTADGRTEFFLLKGWIPTADLTRMDMREFLGMLSPIIKAPIELATNTSLFMGREVERFPGEKQNVLGLSLQGKYANLLRNIIIVQEVDRLVFQQERELGDRAIQSLFGARTYAQDKVIQMRSRVYDLQKQMGELKNAIALATRKWGPDSDPARQAEQRLEQLTFERNNVKESLLKIDPEALSTKKEESSTPKVPKLPTTIQGFRSRARIDLGDLLRKAEQAKRKAAQ